MKNTNISNMVILNKKLTDDEFRLYCVLVMLTDNDESQSGCVSIKTLAEISGKTHETIQRILKELIEMNLVEWAAKKLLDSDKLLNTPSLYGINKNLSHYVMEYDPRAGYFPLVDEVMGDVVFPDAYDLYKVFAMLVGDSAAPVHVSIRELAKLFNKTPKETRKWLQVLIKNSVIETITPDTYIIHDVYRDNLGGQNA